jgi:hypothetical protein
MRFDVPDPRSFAVSVEQLEWVKQESQSATDAGQTKVVLLHCYPSDLKVGGSELMDVLSNFGVRLIDVGHTHYNEIANDGRTPYSATRVDASALGRGAQTLVVQSEVARGKMATDEIRVVIGNPAQQKRAECDQENALKAWPEHGLLGTQLGPNKNGKKW